MVQGAVLLALALVAPLALASEAPPTFHAWGVAATGSISTQSGARACPLGDANGDGHPDLLLHMRGANGMSVLKALAGPSFTRVLWSRAYDGMTTLTCAPDLQAEGRAAALVSIVAPASDPTSLTLPVSSTASEGSRSLQALDGATGATLVDIVQQESTKAMSTGAGGGADVARGWLQPAASGLLLHVTEGSTSAKLTAPLGELSVSLSRGSVSIDVLTLGGRRLSTIAPADPHADVLAYATLPHPASPRVALLTAVDASPIHQAPARIPTLTLYGADGRRLWSVEGEATTSAPVLLPRIGDIDGDGTADLALALLPTAVSTTARVTVLSGSTGAVLFVRDAPEGLLLALPLGPGQGPGDPFLLLQQASPTSLLRLSRIDAAKTTWSIEVDGTAVPVGFLRDRFSGDVIGFRDFTGDAVPDIALSIRVGDHARLQVLSGLDGVIRWTRPVPPDAKIVPIEGSDGASDVLIVDPDGDDLDLTRRDGETGDVMWNTTGPRDGDDVDVQTGRFVGDDNEDALLTTGGAGTGTGRDAGTGGPGSAPGATIIDGSTGGTSWRGSTDEDGPMPPPFKTGDGAASAPQDTAPSLLPILLAAGAVVLAGIGWARVRRN